MTHIIKYTALILLVTIGFILLVAWQLPIIIAVFVTRMIKGERNKKIA